MSVIPSPLPKDIKIVLDKLDYAASTGKDVFDGLRQLRIILNAEFRDKQRDAGVVTNPSPSEAELKEAIRQVNHGGIDSDGSTDTDRLYLLFTRYSNQQALEARIDEQTRSSPSLTSNDHQSSASIIVARSADEVITQKERLAELRNLKAQEGGEG